MIFKVSEKKGFCCEDECIRIYDFKGREFYVFNKPVNKRYIYFNLPPGNYKTENVLYELKKPVRYKIPLLPRSQRKYKLPKKLKIVWCNNPNKCTVVYELNTVYLDYSIFELPIPAQVYILFHEIGHHFYKTEEYCDIFASKYMILKGFNPSQLQLSNECSLSKRAIQRKQFSNNFNKKIKNEYTR